MSWISKLIEFLLNQGALGFAVLCLGYVCVLFYKEIKRTTDIIIDMSKTTSTYIQENTNQLVELREDLKDDRETAKELNKKMIEILEFTLRDFKR